MKEVFSSAGWLKFDNISHCHENTKKRKNWVKKIKGYSVSYLSLMPEVQNNTPSIFLSASSKYEIWASRFQEFENLPKF